MAQKRMLLLEDDVDGSNATKTIRFGLDGAQYEIDLSNKNAAKLRRALQPWADVARRVRGRTRRTARARLEPDRH